MKERLSKEAIAVRTVKEFREGDYVNLGVGIPTLCARFIPQNKRIFLHAENGLLGYGPLVQEFEWEKADPDYLDGGANPVHFRPGMCCFDIDLSFDIIRGGHLDFTVMGGLEVSEKGDLANWTRGGIGLAGIGGSLDLAVGPKRVIICMEHTTKQGEPRIVRQCKYPLTGKECVNTIITDISVIEVTDQGLLVKELAPGWTVEEIQSLTEPSLIIAQDLKEIEL